MNFPSALVSDGALEYIQTQLIRKRITPHLSVRQNIKDSRLLRDMRNYVIQISILLETLMKPFLEKMLEIHIDIISTLIKSDSLRDFVKFQLPHFLITPNMDSEKLATLLNQLEATQSLVSLRNQVIHNNANPQWSENNFQMCKSTLEVVHLIENEIDFQLHKFQVRELAIGHTSHVHEQMLNVWFIKIFSTRSEQLFSTYHGQILQKSTLDRLIQTTNEESDSIEPVKIDLNNARSFVYKITTSGEVSFLLVFFPTTDSEINSQALDSTLIQIKTTLGAEIKSDTNFEVIFFFSGLPSQTERELGAILKDLFLKHNLSLVFSKKHLVVNKDMKPIIKIFEHHNGTLSEKVLMDLLQNSNHFQKFNNDIFQFVLYFLNHLKVELKEGIRYYSMNTKISEIIE
ncbi:MAG: hypothetical protein GPJ54_19825 [Candidatus Heimdallarchaeota archaeon]|nr:hypothetical protein [Candidatus Heimdallarchaeota archaeon]